MDILVETNHHVSAALLEERFSELEANQEILDIIYLFYFISNLFHDSFVIHNSFRFNRVHPIFMGDAGCSDKDDAAAAMTMVVAILTSKFKRRYGTCL